MSEAEEKSDLTKLAIQVAHDATKGSASGRGAYVKPIRAALKVERDARTKAEQQLNVIANDLDRVGIQRATTGGETPRELPVWNRVELLRVRMERAEAALHQIERHEPGKATVADLRGIAGSYAQQKGLT